MATASFFLRSDLRSYTNVIRDVLDTFIAREKGRIISRSNWNGINDPVDLNNNFKAVRDGSEEMIKNLVIAFEALKRKLHHSSFRPVYVTYRLDEDGTYVWGMEGQVQGPGLVFHGDPDAWLDFYIGFLGFFDLVHIEVWVGGRKIRNLDFDESVVSPEAQGRRDGFRVAREAQRTFP